jgi:AAA domain
VTGPVDDYDLEAQRRLRLTPASEIELKPTHWLWDWRIPLGAVTIAPGREGIGKSLFFAWLTAQITNGTLDGAHLGQPKSVFYAASEDSWERTIAGRLKAAGADLTRVYRVDVQQYETITQLVLPRDCAALADEIRQLDVVLLVLDPLISMVDSRIDVNREELRRALEPVAALADTTGCAIVGLAHFNKADGRDVLSRITGSRAFSAVARAAIAFARDPDADDGSCVLSQAKNNLGPLDVPSLRYVIEQVELDTDEGQASWGRLVMQGETKTTVEQCLSSASDTQNTVLKEATAWLRDYLGEHKRSPSAEIKKAGVAAGIAARTLTRAREQLNVVVESKGKPRRTFWSLPS